MAVPSLVRVWHKNSVPNEYFRAEYLDTQIKCILFFFFFKVLINSEIKWPHKHRITLFILTLQWQFLTPLQAQKWMGWGGVGKREKSTMGKEKGFISLPNRPLPSSHPPLPFQNLPLKLLPGPIPSLLLPNDYVCLESTVQ